MSCYCTVGQGREIGKGARVAYIFFGEFYTLYVYEARLVDTQTSMRLALVQIHVVLLARW